TQDSDTAYLSANLPLAPLRPHHDRALEQNDRRNMLRRAAQSRLARQRLTKETRRDQRFFNPAELLQRAFAQTAAQRIADQQRAGQHGGADDDAEEHGEVAAPVKKQVPQTQTFECHDKNQGSGPRGQGSGSRVSTSQSRLLNADP